MQNFREKKTAFNSWINAFISRKGDFSFRGFFFYLSQEVREWNRFATVKKQVFDYIVFNFMTKNLYFTFIDDITGT